MNLKYLILFCLLPTWINVHAGNTHERQKVYSLVKQKQSTEWYQIQADLWNDYLKLNPNDADAWLNYYTAMRMLKIYQKGVSAEDLTNVVKLIEKAIPNTFEYHYIAHWNGGLTGDKSLIDHLKKAQELGPERVELCDDLVNYYELKRDKENLENIAKRWFASNDISAGLYSWNYNMLQSTEPDAILFTVGDNDTYPSIVLQHANKIRPDVAVFNASLISLDDYRNRFFKELGIPLMSTTYKDYDDFEGFQKAIVAHVIKNSYRPVYFAISANPSLYDEFKNDIYNVGMAYKYSPKKFDNIAVIKKNYEKVYLLDNLKYNFNSDISQGVVDHINCNYLISLLTLYNHYKESEDVRVVEIEKLINQIAAKSHMEKEVSEVLNKPSEAFKSVISDPKIIERYLQKISDTLFAGKTEVTNEMYTLFLTDLLKQKRYDDLNIAKSNAVNWRQLLPENERNKSEEGIFPNGSPEADKAPICNITYEAALMYCKWLSDVYNHMEGKKKYEQVEFRLPTEKEWIYLAAAGNTGNKYPWDGPFVRNNKGCFLANLNVSDNDPIPGKEIDSLELCSLNAKDGSIFPVRSDSYYPNNFGLYCLIGNVSEMVMEKGVAKGGSWNTRPDDATINSKGSYTGANAETGFRIIMIIR